MSKDPNDELRASGTEGLRQKFDTSVSSKRPPNRPRLNVISADALDRIDFPPVRYVVPGVIAQGLTILGGAPKRGKSWACLDMALAVAAGGVALGSIDVEQGDVLYLALEDNQRRLQGRMRQLMGPEASMPPRLQLATECPSLDKGGAAAIEAWCQEAPNPRLIIVDVLSKVRPERREKDGLYDGDYKAIEPLKRIADQFEIAVIVVHHTSKRGDAADPFDTLSGTTGLSGAADTVLILQHTTDGPKLYGRGRDIEEFEKAMRFDQDTGRWAILGDAAEVHKSQERKIILDHLLAAKNLLSAQDIANALDKHVNTVSKMLSRLLQSGDICKERRGRYRHRFRPELAEVSHKVTNDDEGPS